MGIDKVTPTYLWLQIDYNTNYIKELKSNAADLDNKDYLFIDENKSSLKPSEYYFDESESSIHIDFVAIGQEGKTYISLDIPLTNTILIDILGHSIKKLNKLKGVMESLK